MNGVETTPSNERRRSGDVKKTVEAILEMTSSSFDDSFGVLRFLVSPYGTYEMPADERTAFEAQAHRGSPPPAPPSVTRF